MPEDYEPWWQPLGAQLGTEYSPCSSTHQVKDMLLPRTADTGGCEVDKAMRAHKVNEDPEFGFIKPLRSWALVQAVPMRFVFVICFGMGWVMCCYLSSCMFHCQLHKRTCSNVCARIQATPKWLRGCQQQCREERNACEQVLVHDCLQQYTKHVAGSSKAPSDNTASA